MDKKFYLAEVSAKLRRIFNTTKEGHKPLLSDKHRYEGFMQAGVFWVLQQMQSYLKLWKTPINEYSVNPLQNAGNAGWKNIRRMQLIMINMSRLHS